MRLWFAILLGGLCFLNLLKAQSSSSLKCLQFLKGASCECKALRSKIQVFCSCLPVKTLDLRDLSEDQSLYLASSFHLGNCRNTSVMVFPGAFSYLHILENVTFNDISRLTVESNGISLTSFVDVFTLRFYLIKNLSLRKNAISIHSEGMNFKIHNSTIMSLMKSAIVGKIRELVMEEMLFKVRPWPGSVVCQGAEGASVTMRSVTVKQGLSGRWIIGNVSRLSIVDSNLRLFPGAFAGVNTNTHGKSQFGVVLSGNNFMMPHLPSHTLPSDGFLLSAKRNYIVCRCPNLVWLREPPNNLFKEGIKASLVCRNATLASVLESCQD